MSRRKTVSFQGEKGAFSQVAVQQLLGADVDVRPCQRFEEVFRASGGRRCRGRSNTRSKTRCMGQFMKTTTIW